MSDPSGQTEDLPEPHDGMTPEEKGELLLRYVRAGEPLFTEFDDGDRLAADFSSASLAGLDMSGTALNGAYLAFTDCTGAQFEKARIANACLHRAVLNGADLSFAVLTGTQLDEADLRGASLFGADLRGADLSSARLEGCSLVGARLEGACLARADGFPTRVAQCIIDPTTYFISRWTPQTLATWVHGGALLLNQQGFPDDVQRWFRGMEGLTLFLSTRLLPWDQTMLHAFACSVLGADTDVRIAEYTETGEDSCRVRLTGSAPNDLTEVAEHISRVSWRADHQAALASAGIIAAGPSMDFVRTHLDKQELWASGPEPQAEIVLQKSWDADLLQAGLDQVLELTGVKGLVEVGARTGQRLLANLAKARDEATVARWNAAIAKEELAEEDDDG